MKNLCGCVFFLIFYFILFYIDKRKFSIKYRNFYLFISSLIVYAYLDIKYLILLLFVIFYTYYLGKKVKNNKLYLYIEVILSLFVFILYKMSNYFIFMFNIFTNNNIVFNIVLPIGLSFYLLKSISYVFDVYHDRMTSANFINIGLYLSFFPQIISGPISDPKFLTDQFNDEKRINACDFTNGIQILFIGLFKKVVLADNINVFVSEIYRAPNIYSSLSVVLCVIAYSIELYCDFSGYSDMSIGVSKMIGFDIERNFNLPYISCSITEFWSRWHISLSNWLKKYIYIPLGGNRNGFVRTCVNLLFTMMVSGVWHGSTINFIVWGILQGILLIIDKFIAKLKKNKKFSIISVVVTFIIISLSWVLFRSPNLETSMDIYRKLISFEKGISYYSTWAIISTVLVFIITVYMSRRNNRNYTYILQDLTTIKGLIILFVFVGLILGFAYTGFSPFIYGTF